MNIAFLITLDPMDINCWSGTLFYLFHTLNKKHRVDIIGHNAISQTTVYTIFISPSQRQ